MFVCWQWRFTVVYSLSMKSNGRGEGTRDRQLAMRCQVTREAASASDSSGKRGMSREPTSKGLLSTHKATGTQCPVLARDSLAAGRLRVRQHFVRARGHQIKDDKGFSTLVPRRDILSRNGKNIDCC